MLKIAMRIGINKETTYIKNFMIFALLCQFNSKNYHYLILTSCPLPFPTFVGLVKVRMDCLSRSTSDGRKEEPEDLIIVCLVMAFW